MAYIVKTNSGTFAVMRYVDGKQVKKTFKTKKEAIKFRSMIELNPETLSKKILVKDLFEQYITCVTAKKRGHREEEIRIRKLMECPFARKPLADLKRKDIQNYIDRRGESYSKKTGQLISAGTICRERVVLSAIFNWAVRQEMIKDSPVKGVILPKPPEHRERIASKEDIEALLCASRWDGTSPPKNETQLVIAAFIFGCYTGMRAGEIVRLRENWIDGVVITLPAEVTKTVIKRQVALGKEAIRILNLVREAFPKTLFYMKDMERDAIFRKVRDKADLREVRDEDGYVIKEGLNFHDSRATFCTWAASPDPKTGSPRLDVMALSRQTGHKDLKMLMRYYRASAESLASRLD